MIVITGGAGMIGSMMAWHLNTVHQREDIVIVDRILHPDQWQNMCHRQYANYLDKDELPAWLSGASGQIDAVIHMGAISATTERDFNKLVQDNIRYSQFLWNWCAENEVPFLYASSAATYGGGEFGYDDEESTIDQLRPLNGYGYSKQFFDQWALRQCAEGLATPPQWCGFKFFNVYGPNEYHKERMASVAFHTFNQFRDQGHVKLFKSHKAGYADGMQLRDFVYVKDAVSVMAHFLDQPQHSGLYNIGTGEARAFKDLATAVMTSMGREPSIEYIDMPQDLMGKYQYFTEANIEKLRNTGYTTPFHTLEQGVQDYVQQYLMQADPYC
ncbi:ADP-glyceromanno-heptose 6-epimerase precursor [Methylobacillus rhizosphaerae]|uniref:ADP-L-glycero-D-manno-heptose-6-epimerase n=1 Tax=Methylobacillus rhizosphaerae TaxID=551994 RepID=A0A239AIX9_9PROT|nr:ADP-glyceromanno-heptose 6-epimerase [Methylobacillus rhizosphaerae]SNR94883.1 ADP-glyceromanno-heptose 6-epimerase precursor [Methylobacillus rhizosphaerae]